MLKQQATARRGQRSAWPVGRSHVGRSGLSRTGRFGGRRDRAATSTARLPGMRAGGRPPTRRRGKAQSGRSPVSLMRGVLGALGSSKPSKGVKGGRKGPALLALVGGLGAAGAAAFKRRQGNQAQSGGSAGGQTGTPAGESS